MTRPGTRDGSAKSGFTLVELLVVISIISLLISILLPSMSRAREQAKSLHCLARLKDFGIGLATYENMFQDTLPPAEWEPDNLKEPAPPGTVKYGWAELLFSFLYREEVRVPNSYPVQRGFEADRWQEYFQCKTADNDDINSGNYRVYLPAWAYGSYSILADGTYGMDTHAIPTYGGHRERVKPRLPLIGDANERSERGDGLGTDDCSYIDAGEANYAGSDGATNGNRFSDRHYGGTNFLFQDLHAAWSSKLRERLAEDWDLNDVIDIEITP